ncbi:MAG TPA: adenylate/guanylate cyclase domain-containing protein [Gammaproteobacteria bacterium]
MQTPQLKWSETRLWQLVEQRARPGADSDAIDRRIWDLFGETWAIMFTDLAGFSRQVAEFGIIHFLEVIMRQKQLLLPVISEHDGILIKIEADSLLCIFRRAARAHQAALAMQAACASYNVDKRPEDQVLLCIGLGFGELLRIGDSDVYGREVNAASKLGEDTATAGEILLTNDAWQELCRDPELRAEELGVEVAGSPHNFRILY